MNVNASGSKLSNNITGATPTPTPLTPQELLEYLISLTHHTKPATVVPFIQMLANGSVRDHFARDAEVPFFGAMIQAGDLDLFVASFNLYHDLQSSAVAPGDMPYKRSLSLRMSPDWAPQSYGDLDTALCQARIERLSVQPHQHHVPGIGLVHSEVPSATCHCVFTVLRAGAADLIICGSLADPDTVALAISHSSLRWLAITKNGGGFGADDMEGYSNIVRALGTCSTLKHLSIAQPELVLLHRVIGAFQEGNGPKLVSIGLGVNPDENGEPEIDITSLNQGDFLAFMETVSKIPTLRVCRMRSVQIESADSLASNILIPLGKHRSLTELDFKGKFANATSADRAFASEKVATFIVACPSLKNLKVDLGSPRVEQGRVSRMEAGRALQTYLEVHGDLPFSEACLPLGAMLASKHCKLQNLSFRGLHMPTAFSTAIFGAVEHNTSLLKLDVQGCFINLLSTAIVPAALKHNHTIEAFGVPQTVGHYFVVMKGGARSIGFQLADLVELAAQLAFPPGTSLEEKAEANALVPTWLAHANTLFKVTLDKPLENRRAPFAQRSQRELLDRTQAFMSAVAKSLPGGTGDSDKQAFSIAAESVVAHLSDARALRWAIQLSSVTPSSDKVASASQRTMRKEPPYVPSEDLRKVVGYFDSQRAQQEAKAQKKPPSTPQRDIEDFRDAVPGDTESPVLMPHDLPLTAHQAQLYQQAWTQIAMGDVDALVVVLEQGAPVNVMDESQCKNALLMLAVGTGDERMVRALLDHGAIDVGGHAEINAPSSTVAAAFGREAETNLTTTANATTKNTTATATAVTTTTTSASTLRSAAQHLQQD
ncbi:hypothetical protein [Hydrogenophaga sp.]|uniref:hypothetical protein n=1 Tax=Hydrogenophaga sp. TaxID=1904254 RepID=UPI00271BFEA6|nr:hypothetical protein [Hydrogenophaga sp.]MDO9435030.1 hypothetical protein [Hydrogenophaga sp.]